MSYLCIYIRKGDTWYFLERGFDGSTRENGTAKPFDFTERIFMADTIDWTRAVVVDDPQNKADTLEPAR
jgi:hypothetical protein